MGEGQGNEGDEEEADQIQDREGDDGPPGVASQVRGDRNDRDRRGDRRHEDPAVVNPGVRAQEGEDQEQAAEGPVARDKRNHEPAELGASGDVRERDLRHRERHPEGERELGDLPRVRRKSAGHEADHETARDHRRETSPGAEHAGCETAPR